MKIICDKCECLIDRDIVVDGRAVDEYVNVFGTDCPNCNNVIKSSKKPFSDDKKEMKMEIMREEMREKLKKEIKGEI